VSTLADLRALAAAGVPAVVVGRALYEGQFTLAEAIEAARC
jgi:phosphoribosylformimino-5-aminoimidazole carboxamide ribotide isomerase